MPTEYLCMRRFHFPEETEISIVLTFKMAAMKTINPIYSKEKRNENSYTKRNDVTIRRAVHSTGAGGSVIPLAGRKRYQKENCTIFIYFLLLYTYCPPLNFGLCTALLIFILLRHIFLRIRAISRVSGQKSHNALRAQIVTFTLAILFSIEKGDCFEAFLCVQLGFFQREMHFLSHSSHHGCKIRSGNCRKF